MENINHDHIRQEENRILYGHACVEINGIAHECEHGVMQGFKDAVIQNDDLKRENQQLKTENAALHRQLEEKQNRQSRKKSRSDGWER